MTPLARLWRELSLLRARVSPAVFRSYLIQVLVNAPPIFKARTLVPADKAMRGSIRFEFGDTGVTVPLDAIAAELTGKDETPTFGGLREMYASDVYLREFRSNLCADSVLDLGSNRGLFLLLAAVRLKARIAVGIEPQRFYASVFEALEIANPATGCEFVRIWDHVVPEGQLGGDTITKVMHRCAIERIDFVKCDIEGAEFGIFRRGAPELAVMSNVAMELHSDKGDVPQLVAAFEDVGFEVRVRDQLGRAVANLQRGHYLYASRSSDLK